MTASTELRFEHCPYCGCEVELLRSNRKKCEGCGTVYFFRHSGGGDGELRIQETDRSKRKEKAEKRLVAARLKGVRREDERERGDCQYCRLKVS